MKSHMHARTGTNPLRVAASALLVVCVGSIAAALTLVPSELAVDRWLVVGFSAMVGVAGLLALLRTFVSTHRTGSAVMRSSVAVLIVAALLAILPLLSNGLWLLAIVVLALSALLLVVAATLLPGPTDPTIAEIERHLSRLSSAERRKWLILRVVVGTGMFFLGVALTGVLTVGVRTGVGAVFTGLMFVGAFRLATGLVVGTRALWRPTRAA